MLGRGRRAMCRRAMDDIFMLVGAPQAQEGLLLNLGNFQPLK
jgi:hypothetical protein